MKRIALLVEDHYEDLELHYPLLRLKEARFQVDLVGSEKGVEYTGKHGYPALSDFASSQVKAADYDGVVIPGGYSPDMMRRCRATIDFVREMDAQAKLIAAICHGPWIMASACNLKGRTVTSFFSIRDDLVNAGAQWVDKEVVISENLITSRTPQDLVAFTIAIISTLRV
ncbi:MAG: type 1 glutamine amidotransferase domain-containing protein [Syntrophaceae bacterium]|nr:type 1 glutamine amidotransferase [Deltaproteobacteria bacterium]